MCEENSLSSKPLSHMNNYVSIDVHPKLTFAGLHAVKPGVNNVPVAITPTILEPSATRSATTNMPRFLKFTTLWTRFYTYNW